jgi:hypothetical protein
MKYVVFYELAEGGTPIAIENFPAHNLRAAPDQPSLVCRPASTVRLSPVT